MRKLLLLLSFALLMTFCHAQGGGGGGGGTGSQYWASDGTNLWNTNTGNVGIGTATPAAPLDVLASTFDFLVGYHSGMRMTANGNSAQITWGLNNASDSTLISMIDAGGNSSYIGTINCQLGNVNYGYPPLQGAANTFLKNDGSGNLSWGTTGIIGSATDSAVLSTSLSFHADSTYAIHIAGTIASATFTVPVPADGLQHQITIGTQAIITTITWSPAANIDGTVPTAALAKGLISLRWNPTTHKWQGG